jgi:hypothetical protein
LQVAYHLQGWLADEEDVFAQQHVSLLQALEEEV